MWLNSCMRTTLGQASLVISQQDNETPLLLQMVQQRQWLCPQSQHLLPEERDLTLALPWECLSCVFAKLGSADRNSCSLVCKRWHSIDAKSRSHLSLEARSDIARNVRSILLRFDHVTSLSLKCQRRFPSIEDSTLELIGRSLPRLQKLKLKGCRALTDAGLELFSIACPSLKKLSCSSCSFGAVGLNAILLHCQDLEDLSVKRFKRLLDNPPHSIAPCQGKLQRLSLKDMCNAQFFGSLIRSTKRLHTLVIARNPGYWDHLFQTVTENLTELVELRCEFLHMSDTALTAIAKCKKLEVLYLVKPSDCTDQGINALVAGCERLRKLYIDDRKSSRLGDAGLLGVAKSCRQLKELVLIGVNATGSSLAEIASSCTGLERIALCNSETIKDAEIHCIGEKCNSLKKLCIKNCPISDYGLEVFVNACPSLTKVKVRKCPNVTPFAVFWLQKNRVSLKVTVDSPMAENGNQIRYEQGNRIINSPTTMPCSSRSTVLRSKLSVAASNLLRKFPKSSWATLAG